MEHPTAEQIESFGKERLGSEERALVVVHLAACSRCRERYGGRLDSTILAREESAYDAPISRALLAVRRDARAWAREDGRAGQTLAAFLEVVDNHNYDDGPRLTGWCLCRELLALSRSYRHKDAWQMLRYANFAKAVVDAMDHEDYPAPLLADFRACVVAEVANAYRVNDALDDAEDYMRRAELELTRGTGDPLLRARVLDLKASLRSSQRKYGEAIRYLKAAYVLYRRVGDCHLAGRALISRGFYTGYDGRPEEGLWLLEQGLAQIDAEKELDLIASALHGKVSFLADLGRYREARALLEESGLAGLYRSDALSLLRLRWEEGKIAAGLGDLGAAEAALVEARRGFAVRRLSYKAALVALDLSVVWLRQGKSAADLSPTVRELLATFRFHRIGREAVAALLVLRQACERDHLSLELLLSVAGFLRRFERDPTARFEYAPVV